MKKRFGYLFGCVLMIIASLIPIFCFGNMIHESWTREERYQQFVKGVDDATVLKTLEASVAYNDRLVADNQIVDPFAGEDYKEDYQILEDGDAVYGYLSIPKISVLEPVYLGADPYHLALGLGHVAGTDLPVEGSGVRSVIAGHRSGIDKVYFRHLDKLEEGDDLYFDNGKEIIHYRMLPNKEIILPAEWEKLQSNSNKNIMTLITCDPIPIYNKRLLVNFERVGIYEKAEVKTSVETQKVLHLAFEKAGQEEVSVVKSSSHLYLAV